jgi:hypothetical protein
MKSSRYVHTGGRAHALLLATSDLQWVFLTMLDGHPHTLFHGHVVLVQGTHHQAKSDNGTGSALILLVELWRSDNVTSVVELDSEGNIMNTAEQQAALGELYPPGG